jgi:spore germination protein KC
MVKNWGGNPNFRLNDVITAWRSAGRQPIMAAVTIKGDPKKGISVNNMKKATPNALGTLDSLAVFKKGTLLGYLSLTDSRNYLWIEDNLVRTAMSVPCGKKRFISVNFYNSKTRTKARIVKGKPEVHVNIRAESYLDGTQCANDLTKVATFKKYEKLVEKEIRDEVGSTIKKVQQ